MKTYAAVEVFAKKCVVEVLEEKLSEPKDREDDLTRVSQRLRLACQAKVVGDVVISFNSIVIKNKVLFLNQESQY